MAVGKGRSRHPNQCLCSQPARTVETARSSLLRRICLSTKFFVDNTNSFVYRVHMYRRNQPLPTDAELEILRELWTRGPSTVREVYEEHKAARQVGYTTILKFLQI